MSCTPECGCTGQCSNCSCCCRLTRIQGVPLGRHLSTRLRLLVADQPTPGSVPPPSCSVFLSRLGWLVHSMLYKISHMNTTSFHYLRNGPAFLRFLFSPFFLVAHKYHETRSQMSNQVPDELSLAHELSSAAPCPAVRCCGVLCRAACFAVRTLSYMYHHTRSLS